MQLSESTKKQFCDKALSLKTDIEADFLSLGAMLHKIRAERYFEAGWSSWEEFSMELKMPQSSISRIIRIYEVFVLRFKFAPAQIAGAGGWTTVSEYLPLVSDKTTYNEAKGWIEQSAMLTRADVRRSVQEAKSGVSMVDCKHPNEYTLRCCPDCGDRWKVL